MINLKLINKSLRLKMSLLILITVSIIVSIVGAGIYFERRHAQEQNVNERLKSQLEDMYHMLELSYNERKEYVKNSMVMAHDIFYNRHDTAKLALSETEESITITDQISKSAQTISIPPLVIGKSSLLNNTEIVDRIMHNTKCAATIFQKTSQGFVRIATNVINNSGERAIGTSINYDSPVVQTIEQGLPYYGRAFVVNDWYYSAYEPIKINGEIVGMLFVGAKEKNLTFLKQVFLGTKYYETGYPYLMSSDGNLIIHPTKEGESLNNTKFFKEFQINSEGKFNYLWPEDATGATKIAFYKYFAPYDAFVVISVYKQESIIEPLNQTRNIIIIGVLGVIIILFFILRTQIKSITDPLNILVENINQLSKGNFAKRVNIEREDEIGNISSSVNILVDGLTRTSLFASEIGKGNLKADYIALGDNDHLGNALLSMRNNLNAVAEEDFKRNWATNGLAQMGDILRKQTDKEEELFFNVLSFIVTYLEANQGGLFILNKESDKDIYVELVASYAYNKRKYSKKRIDFGEGLVGQSIQEGDTIFLTEVPEEYVEITSGLGKANPRCILIVPLKVNEDIHGVVEIASFKILDNYKIEFVQKLAESIASTISNVKINIRTKLLLEQSQQQAEELKSQEEEMRQNMEELAATQEEMKRKSAELESAFSAIDATLGAIEYTTDGTIINANKYIIDILRLSQSDLIGKKLIDLIETNNIDFEEYNQIWNKTSKGIVVKREQSYKAGNSKKIWFLETYNPIKNEHGEIFKILCGLIDITESKELFIASQQKNELLKAQEEEMRQNLEELASTQEEMQRVHNEQQKKDKEIKEKYEQEMISLQEMLMNQQEESEKILKQKLQEQEIELNSKTEELKSQEEELRQNLEELSATQEEMQRVHREQKMKDDKIKAKYEQEMISLQEMLMNQQEESEKILKQKLQEQEIELNSKTEELKAQEEELRQNLEELSATQEELEKKQLILIEKEQNITTIFNNSPLAIVLINKQNGEIETNNNPFNHLTGYSNEELKGNNINKILKLLKLDRLKDGVQKREKSFRKDGTSFISEIIIREIIEKEKPKYLLFLKDITKELKFEQEMIQNIELANQQKIEITKQAEELKKLNDNIQKKKQ